MLEVKSKKIMFMVLSIVLLFSIIGYAELSISIFSIERVENPFPTPEVGVFVTFSGSIHYNYSSANNTKSSKLISFPGPVKSELLGYSYNFGWDDYITTPDNRPHEIGLNFYRHVSGSENSFSFSDGWTISDTAGGWYTVYAGLSGQWEVHLMSPSGENTVEIPETKYAQRTDFVEPYIPETGKTVKEDKSSKR